MVSRVLTLHILNLVDLPGNPFLGVHQPLPFLHFDAGTQRGWTDAMCFSCTWVSWMRFCGSWAVEHLQRLDRGAAILTLLNHVHCLDIKQAIQR